MGTGWARRSFSRRTTTTRCLFRTASTPTVRTAGRFARVIDFQSEYAQSLIDDFSAPDKEPHIAITVDMLDTGIDVPEVVNLVFFKTVRSRTKFWQMIGRGTGLRPDLFGPGRHKTDFLVFDFCGNFEFFSQNPETTDGPLGESLWARLFKARLDLIGEIRTPRNGRAPRRCLGCTPTWRGSCGARLAP